MEKKNNVNFLKIRIIDVRDVKRFTKIWVNYVNMERK